MRRSAWLVVLLLLAAACSTEPQAAPTTTTAAAVVTTSTAPTTTTAARVPFETEVKQAAIALLELRNEVFQHPDVSRVAEYIAPTCTCLERERGIVESLVQDGLRWNAPAVQVRGVLIDDPDPTGPAMTLVAAQPATEIVGPDGSAAESVPGKEDAAYRLTLVRDSAGEWTLNALEGVDLNLEAVAEVLAAGLT